MEEKHLLGTRVLGRPILMQRTVARRRHGTPAHGRPIRM
jgi:hypothetical protein